MNCILIVKSIVVIVMEPTHRNQTNLQFVLLVIKHVLFIYLLSCLLCDIELSITDKHTLRKSMKPTHTQTCVAYLCMVVVT